ncbi:hybrid non-ribosomal peptide synthetase/type I polyketide synthase [Beijerinckia indica]|uniref:Amino acid adenylation domain protein n=1 Tax=Beijerinckia indica subsp. indica (strain ATCC 9039 / DSM 1715 / NCIMB 8712) TaxID=395963 RepID=B2IHH5_BEII9|nr:hybrid non-ribosomal peptide synthetase/type I polyketide synthase [Beijerinckia indica]ACB94496.1 amino acid adenylation domain protein [Beijerinckia indica subsp. indica ATCC 9039]
MTQDDDHRLDGAVLPEGAVAIIGISGRFPGASDVAGFWRNIKEGRDCIAHFRDDELDDTFSAQVHADANFVKARPVLDNVDLFDAGFFGMHPREAALTDPQHRLFLECVWEALEDGGYDPSAYPEPIGIFAGCTMNTYFLNNVCADREVIEDFTNNFQLGNYSMMVGAGQEFMATKVAYKLDLRGPAVNIGTACSTSLTAVAQACQSLLLYQADMMLAGGSSISFPQMRGYLYQEGGMVSPDGYCRPFDINAAGTVFGSGVGVVLLKRLEDAVADGDQIYAVIRSAAVNNDGSGKAGYTAPSIDGQAGVILSAHATAGINARSIGYVECHGTATPLGDPIEFEGLVKAFRLTTEDRGFCALGSAKANVGHLDAAAGIIGLIKAVMTLRDSTIPPLLHFSAPNPQIDLADSPFFINKETYAWPKGDEPRRAGVSAFGVGGTNVHVILEEAPLPVQSPATVTNGVYTLPLSARSSLALEQMKLRLADHLESAPDLSLDDVAYTLQVGRRRFDHRTALVCHDLSDAIVKLRAKGGTLKETLAVPNPSLAFMFPGQGTQYAGMGQALYDSQPGFREIIDQGADFLAPLLGADLRDVLYGSRPADEEDPHPIRSTLFAQPALFLVQYATAHLFTGYGFQPNVMIGHSIGEFVAATLASVLTFEEALGFIAERARLMQSMPTGAMLSVRLPEMDLKAILPRELDIAAVNAPELCVVSGPTAEIDAFATLLAQRDIVARQLHTSHAFHSRMMDPVVASLKDTASRIHFQEPKIAYVSCISGQWITTEDVTSPLYWAEHCRRTVRFADALQTMRERGNPVLLEVGTGQTLTTLANQAAAKRKKEEQDQKGTLLRGAISSLPDASRGVDDVTALSEAVAKLWMEGCEPDWASVNAGPCRRVSLPTYPFERKSHWIKAPQSQYRMHEGLPPVVEEQGVEPSGYPLSSYPLQSHIPINTDFMPSQNILKSSTEPTMNMVTNPRADGTSRIHRLTDKIVEIFDALSGDQIGETDYGTSFLELGYDSLFLAQVATQVQKTFGIKVTFRQLLNDFPTVQSLVAHLDEIVPPDPVVEQIAPRPILAATSVAPMSPSPIPLQTESVQTPAGLEGLFREQLHAMQLLLSQQLQVLQGGTASGLGVAGPNVSANVSLAPAGSSIPSVSPKAASKASKDDKVSEEGETSARFKIYRPGTTTHSDDLTPTQKAFIDDLVKRYSARSHGSKDMTQAYRPVLADPRAANGFRQEWKEMVYPVVCARSKGSKIWDVDGNEYVDLVNGFGQTAFGHAPDFVLDAVSEQMKLGFAIGPQTPLAGEVATLFTEMTGNERVTFCNTGSEAVMAAMRVARAVTGRDRVVVFNGAYHGQFDEVLVKGASRNASPRALPVAAGIPRGSVENMVVLPYATPESLEWIRQNADDLAAVVIETVQSRHPAFQPKAFIEEIRAITEKSGTALVFDEVVTGFRVHPGGMQALFGIRADMATYGKVVGGGMPIGVLAGKSRFMDALDGGQWRYGDDSFPEVAPTFFAGTFVRHPLVLAAAKAVLLHLKAAGPQLQENLTARTANLVARMNAELERRGIATRVETFSSFFYMNFSSEDHLATLLFIHMRLLGVHILDGFPGFLTTTHSDADIEHIFTTFCASLEAVQKAGILVGSSAKPAVALSPALSAPALPADVPLTEPQKEIWLAAQLGDAASCSFNESVSLDFKGPLNEKALALSLDDVIARHEALRGSFGKTGENLHIAPQLVIPLQHLDFSAQPDPVSALHDWIDEDAHTPFDLAEGPLVRTGLIKLAAEHHVLVFTAHHIICDGWSANVIINDLAAFYAARSEGLDVGLPAAMPFRRYALNEAAKREGSAATEAYWLDQYKTIPEALDLPFDRPRPAQKSFRGATYSDTIEESIYRGVRQAGAKQGCTLFTTLFAAFQILIGKLTDHSEIVIGVPTAGQSLLDDEILVGHCVNFLPIRDSLDYGKTIADHLQNVRRVTGEAFDHQDFTFGTLVRKLNLRRDPRRLPLTSIQFNVEKLGENANFPGLSTNMSPNAKAFVNFDLFMNVIESDKGLRIDCDYSTDLFDEATIARWVGYFRTLLVSMTRDLTQTLAKVSLLSLEERNWLVTTLNETRAEPDLRPVPELIATQVAKTPDAVAAVFNNVALTYRELDERVNQLAGIVRAQVPGEGRRIGLAVERSLDMLVALIAIMKAGHAYVPLDPHHPAARLQLILDKADVSALICENDHIATLAGSLPVIRLDASRGPSVMDANLPPVNVDSSCYILFTSGSTGTPKGVEVTHRSLANLVWSMVAAPGFKAGDVIVAATTISFDIAAFELYVPLIVGGTVVIASRDDIKGGFGFVSLVEKTHATVIQATPTLARMLLEAGLTPRSDLKVLCGGEALPRDLANALLENQGELWNGYGPTEATVYASTGRIFPGTGPVSIGEPVYNTQLHVLDSHRELVPVGVTGQLYIGGMGLARGYFQRPELDAEAFSVFAVGDGAPQRYYRTGDAVRRLPDGSIEYLGRLDQQIKLRGYRIELGEIESVMRQSPGVQDCAVAVYTPKDGLPRLVGYYVPTVDQQKVPTSELTAYAGGHLPDYMVPSLWIAIEKFPLTPSGKLDRKALPQPEAGTYTENRVITPPTTPLETQLVAIWKAILKDEEIGIHDNIFALGADSIRIFRIAVRMREENINLSAADLMQHPTIAELAEVAAHTTVSGKPKSPSLASFRRGNNNTAGAAR